tara:strand:- start:315 stop:869 length:555 start_codon:yes stop_codon:yes gene_type:complete
MRKYLNKLIALILLMTLSLIIFNYSDDKSDELIDKLNEVSNRSSPGTTEISNPTFRNKGLNTNPYEIKAEKGIQINQDIELYKIEAKFTNDNNELFFIKADEGLYSQINQVIDLVGNVLISDEFGNTTSTESATIDIEDDKIRLLNRVVSISNTSMIKSDSSIIDEVKDTVTYTGNVEVKIKNK